MIQKNTISRALNKIYTIACTWLKEQTFGSTKYRVKYLFFNHHRGDDRRVLIVCFPAFAGKGAKYNYVRTIKNICAYKLFLLDDIGGVDKGNYLLQKQVEQNTKTLIQKKIDETKPDNIVFIGSSKGGYSALYYSTFFDNVDVVIAAPQYYLYDYLIREKKYDNLKVILGDSPLDNEKDSLNMLLSHRISSSEILPKSVYIHYSTNEHTYKEHIENLLSDLRCRGIKLFEDIGSYTNHMDLKYYFPEYILRSLNDILAIQTKKNR